jgi:hypothetical protein
VTGSEPHPLSEAAWNRRCLIEALEAVWDDDFLDHLLTQTAADLRAHGYDPAAAVDAVSHRLTPASAGFWYGQGFTAHEGHHIDLDPHAKHNLFGHGDAEVTALLGSDLPRDYLTNVLRVAASPDEVDTFVTNWRNATPEQRADYANREAMQAALTDHPNPIPGCCP